MPGLTHALDLLETPAAGKPPAVCVLFGSERFLMTLVRKQIVARITGGRVDADASVSVVDGESADVRDVVDELSTVALFGGGGPRMVIVDEAEKFVERHRAALESYCAKPRTTGVLLLELPSFPSNTRLYKTILMTGLIVDCRPPEVATSRAKVKPVDESRIARWLSGWARVQHRVQLPHESAEAMLRLVGPEFGLLDTELAKLALFVPEKGEISPRLVDEVVGGWRTKTTWDLNEAIADGDAAQALEQLDRLLQAGQEPQALFGALAWSLRRYAAAVRMVLESERRGQRPDFGQLLQQAGFWGEGSKRAEVQLRQMGRARARRLYRWLLEADLALKGSHSHGHDARFMLEQLIVRLARQLGPQGQATSNPTGGGRTASPSTAKAGARGGR